MSETTSEVEAGPVTKVARDLTEITKMAALLDDQAEHKAGARLDGMALPGGLAMVNLAPVANLEAWGNRFATAERLGRETAWIEDEEPDNEWEPVLQTLCFWSEQWRREHDAEYGQRPTVHSEASFIRASLNWAWDHVMEWDDFALDIRKARVRMENVLYSGERAERGVPCLYDECRGVRLVRKLVPARDAETGLKTWRYTNWHCPRCKRQWDEDRYAAMVAGANESTKVEDIAGETWCAVEYAARRVDRSESTIRQWIHKGYLSRVCLIAGRRVGFVLLSEVTARHEKSQRRKRAA